MNLHDKEIVHSSESENWATPQWLYDLLNKEFKFELDAAASLDNAKCSHFYSEKDNGLVLPWANSTFCNPPFNKKKKMYIYPWTQKAVEEMKNGRTSVLLLPGRTGNKFWWDHCLQSCEIRFIKGRLKFSNSKDTAPFDSAVVIFRKECDKIHFSPYPDTTWWNARQEAFGSKTVGIYPSLTENPL